MKRLSQNLEIEYEQVPATKEQIADIFDFVFSRIEKYDSVDNLQELSYTYNNLGDNDERRD